MNNFLYYSIDNPCIISIALFVVTSWVCFCFPKCHKESSFITVCFFIIYLPYLFLITYNSLARIEKVLATQHYIIKNYIALVYLFVFSTLIVILEISYKKIYVQPFRWFIIYNRYCAYEKFTILDLWYFFTLQFFVLFVTNKFFYFFVTILLWNFLIPYFILRFCELYQNRTGRFWTIYRFINMILWRLGLFAYWGTGGGTCFNLSVTDYIIVIVLTCFYLLIIGELFYQSVGMHETIIINKDYRNIKHFSLCLMFICAFLLNRPSIISDTFEIICLYLSL